MDDYELKKDSGTVKYNNLTEYKKEKFVNRRWYLLSDEDEKKIDGMKDKYKKKRQRFRTESPPKKKHRDRRGFNKGKFRGCSYCRPKIANRIANHSAIRQECNYYKKLIKNRQIIY